MTNMRFKELELTGSPYEIGYQHGLQLKSRIGLTLEYYLALFNLPETKLFAMADNYRAIINDFNPAYAEEIEAIAAGSGIDAHYIYALNSRSEILNNLSIPECTAVYKHSEALLAQNWDWSQRLEPLVTEIKIQHANGHRISMLTEPGIIGKIGMNSAGIGVCLNILKVEQRLQGLPVHILLRAILDCRSMAAVTALITRIAPGKASHILVASATGEYSSVEFAGDGHYQLPLDDGLILHTNHFLADPDLNTVEAFPSTYQRYQTARKLSAADSSEAGIVALLLDQTQGENSICRDYSPSLTAGFGNVGTVFSVIMQLQRGCMLVRAGSDPDTDFYPVYIN